VVAAARRTLAAIIAILIVLLGELLAGEVLRDYGHRSWGGGISECAVVVDGGGVAREFLRSDDVLGFAGAVLSANTSLRIFLGCADDRSDDYLRILWRAGRRLVFSQGSGFGDSGGAAADSVWGVTDRLIPYLRWERFCFHVVAGGMVDTGGEWSRSVHAILVNGIGAWLRESRW